MKYIVKCKELFFKKITPSSYESVKKEEYIELINIANSDIEKIGVNNFTSYFQEGQYFIDLWTAHILFQRKDISNEIRKECLDVIKGYLNNPLAPEVSLEEEEWIKSNS